MYSSVNRVHTSTRYTRWNDKSARWVGFVKQATLTSPIVSSASLMPVAPVAYQVILEPGIGQFREFEPPRVHTRTNSWGLFLVHKLTCGKRGSVS